MNKVVLIGRLTRDVEIRQRNNAEATMVASFGIAVDRGYKKEGQATADFINCVAFGATGDNIGKYFSKGNKIAVTGRIQVDSYKDKEGKSQVSTKVVVDGFEFCESKRDSSNSNAQTPQSYPQTETFFTASEETDENDLPF
jgi:single-strand DNA-binding protein